VEHASGTGALSLLVARAFPNATVLSIEGGAAETDAHLAAALRGGIANNIIARGSIDVEHVKHLAESPEFFRYQAFSGDFVALLLSLVPPPSSSSSSSSGGGAPYLRDAQTFLGTLASLAATTFLRVPSAPLLSLALTAFHDAVPSLAFAVPPALAKSPGCEAGDLLVRTAALLQQGGPGKLD
jgi:hypothetical protein